MSQYHIRTTDQALVQQRVGGGLLPPMRVTSGFLLQSHKKDPAFTNRTLRIAALEASPVTRVYSMGDIILYHGCK